MATNPLEDDPKRDARIRERAYLLWEADGRPNGGDLEYWERARELIGMEDNADAGLLPNPETHQPLSGLPEGVEEASIQENLGEFPDRLSDQGEHPSTPEARKSTRKPPVRTAKVEVGSTSTPVAETPAKPARAPGKGA